MELDAFDRQFLMTQPHDQSVGRFGRYFERIRQRLAFDDERMISSGLKFTFDPCKQRFSVVFYGDRFSVHRLGPADYLAAEMLPYRLMAETNAKDRQFARKSFHHID